MALRQRFEIFGFMIAIVSWILKNKTFITSIYVLHSLGVMKTFYASDKQVVSNMNWGLV